MAAETDTPRGFTPARRLMASAFVMDLGIAVIGLSVQFKGRELGATPLQLGLIGAISALSYAVFCLLTGRLSDSWGRRLLASASCVGCGIVWLIMTRAGSPAQLLCLVPFSGASIALFWPTLQAWLSQVSSSPSRLTRNIGDFNVSWTIGLMFGAPVAGLLWGYGHDVPFVFAAVIILLLLVFLQTVHGGNRSGNSAAPEPVDEAPVDPTLTRQFLYLAWIANFAAWFSRGLTSVVFPKLGNDLGMAELSAQTFRLAVPALAAGRGAGVGRSWDDDRVFRPHAPRFHCGLCDGRNGRGSDVFRQPLLQPAGTGQLTWRAQRYPRGRAGQRRVLRAAGRRGCGQLPESARAVPAGCGRVPVDGADDFGSLVAHCATHPRRSGSARERGGLQVTTKAVILAAGVGTRMRPLTLRRPKPLVPVAGRPLIEHIIGGLVAGGFTDIGLVVGYMQDLIRERIGDGRRLGARVEYIVQETPTGTGGATLLAEEFVHGERFFLGWGDIMVPPKSYREIAEICERENADALLSVNYVDDPWEGAAVYISDDGHVERIVEKPSKGTATTNFNNAGLFVFGPELIDALETTPPSKERGEVEVPSAIDAMLASGKRIRAYEIDGYWSDVARPATALQISGEMIAAASLGGVIVHPDARVASAARLIGPVRIGAGARVDGGTLGPNVTVMERATVGAGAKLTNACLYPGSSVGPRCELDWAIVEEGVQVAEGVALKGSAEQAAVEEGN